MGGVCGDCFEGVMETSERGTFSREEEDCGEGKIVGIVAVLIVMSMSTDMFCCLLLIWSVEMGLWERSVGRMRT